MKTGTLFLLILLTACQSKTPDEPTATSSEQTTIVDSIQGDELKAGSHALPTSEVDLDQPSWELVTSAFQKIDAFPIKGSVFPLQAIVIENDTLKMNGDICYSFPAEIIRDFVENNVDIADSLAIWFDENSSMLGKGTDFDYGVYPLGKFQNASKNYYIYCTLDYLTGRGSHNLSFYVATTDNQKWKSQFLGEKSYSKYNTYEYIDGEEFIKDRMVSERNLSIDLQDDKLVITLYYGEYAIDDEFDVFAGGTVSGMREVVLE